MKAQCAAKGGATGVLVVDHQEQLTGQLLGSGKLDDELRAAWDTWSCGFPHTPVLLLSKADGEWLLAKLQKGGAGCAAAEFKIRADNYPRRTVARHLCHSCALLLSGIGILYGIIQCFAVKVGAEFIAADDAARSRGVPCVCVDVDLNDFFSRLGAMTCPTPWNLLKAIRAWLAFPRIAFLVLFPLKDGSVDVIGSIVLHLMSFQLRTWAAFLLAGFAASFVTSNLLQLLSYGAEQGAENTGLVKKRDRYAVEDMILLVVEMYMLPRIYEAVAASRDEAMYQLICLKSRRLDTRRMVVVVGAGHANGILRRMRERGI
eukprot:NODE_13198_length_1179_cov_7.084601.p1 GENE.NODE_13198_length_1179_cov_7.084601~~NODE_13198_length_1179_cov_7.084601.p1  ORF type:complete len:337 (-),score=106.56 NODE_13198_length_1179_cov_7.084601:167-1117(-)